MKQQLAFYSFWIAKTSISLADVIYVMVITTFIYQETSSALTASLFPLFKALSSLIGGLTSPLLYNYFNFKKLLVGLQIIKAFLISILLIHYDLLTSNMYSLLGLIFIISFVEGWGNPLLQSVIPNIVDKDQLVKANSAISITSQTVQIAGYSFTGIAVLMFGHNPTLVFNVALLWLTVGCLFLTAKNLNNIALRSDNQTSKIALMKQGWSLLWSNKHFEW